VEQSNKAKRSTRSLCLFFARFRQFSFPVGLAQLQARLQLNQLLLDLNTSYVRQKQKK
jgi:hypothetical protein